MKNKYLEDTLRSAHVQSELRKDEGGGLGWPEFKVVLLFTAGMMVLGLIMSLPALFR